MKSKMTMELVLGKKKGVTTVAEEHNHNVRLNNGQNIALKNRINDSLKVCNLSISKNNFKGYNKRPLGSSKSIFSSLTLLSLSLFVMLLILTEYSNASPYIMSNCLLNPQLAVDPNEAENCKYGFEVDACGTYFCSKGPKSYCGGKFERYGVCGEGLMCNKCNRCTGCSTKTFECWYDDNCIWSSD